MKSADGKPMVIGIAVDGDQIAAYACNGTDDEAWFFGNQKDGKIDITSKFKDTLNGRVRRQGRGRRPDHERRRVHVQRSRGSRARRDVHRRL